MPCQGDCHQASGRGCAFEADIQQELASSRCEVIVRIVREVLVFLKTGLSVNPLDPESVHHLCIMTFKIMWV